MEIATEVLKEVTLNEDELDKTLQYSHDVLKTANSMYQALRNHEKLQADAFLEKIQNVFRNENEIGMPEEKLDVPIEVPKHVIASSAKAPDSRPDPSDKAFGIFPFVMNKQTQEIQHLQHEIQITSAMSAREMTTNEIQDKQQSALETFVLVKKHIDNMNMVLQQTEENLIKEAKMPSLRKRTRKYIKLQGTQNKQSR